jgi:sugar phosphate isomerase/epimerase
MVVHPCQHFDYSEANKDAIYEYNMNFYKRFIPYYEEYGVKVAIENINFHDKFGFASSPEVIKTIHDELDNDAFTVCLDVGHVNMVGISPADALRTLGARIGCLHIHDNDGVHDTHTLPYYGTIKWAEVTKALADIDYNGTLNYEASGFISKIPLSLYEESARYMSLVGHSLIDEIEKYKAQK